ncbi:uncharacterized protein PV09_05085 [Verruconis gallopava]|uniref:Altered inheritance of mitochondria protein 6 n=1 Tax=Verruconis gallopava TaxID=253628 RepID=A0A0D1YT12_9PEZI|nr:uncharacterized protein PV09_05085 [Verruconis gallopava]KIW03782.1 hypothetical protein PV09_05085 [Verruconis gallopava]
MASSRNLAHVEDDVESSAGRESEEPGEAEALLNQKQPYVSTQAVSSFENDECPICLRKARWRALLSMLRLKGKQRVVHCAHDRPAIEECRRLSRTAPAARIRRRRCRLLTSFILVMFALFGLWNLVTLLIGLGPLIWDPSLAVDRFFPNWGMPGEPGEGLTGYPTDFTRDVEPIPCHSHNDYWRRVPLYEAIHYGCVGVEADVWLFDDELFVGHTTASLTKNRTLRSLYVDPLVRILDRMNPSRLEYGAGITPERINGVFDEVPDQTLVLLIDFKMDGREQLPVVSAHLEALRSKGYLTYFNGQDTVSGPVTVVATGNAPFDLLTANATYRDIFFDAPLDKLAVDAAALSSQHEIFAASDPASSAGQGSTGVSPSSSFTPANSYYASVDFKSSIGFPYRGRLSHRQLRKLRSQIKAAHDKGLKARYWNTPTWPVGLRNHIWKILIDEGADYLNVDDLRSAKMVDWERSWRRHRWMGNGI